MTDLPETKMPEKRQYKSYGSTSETDFGPSGSDFNLCVVCGHERWIHHTDIKLCEGPHEDRYGWCKCKQYRWRIWRFFHKEQCARLKAEL